MVSSSTNASEENNGQNKLRDSLALVVLIFAFLAISVLAGVAIVVNSKETMAIFNVILPVVATWVGTVLAFYFGKVNFESANRQVRQMIEKLTPEQRASAPIASIMRRIDDTISFTIPARKSDADIPLIEFRKLFSPDVSRLPVLNTDGTIKYMIHDSRLAEYLVSGGKDQDTLEKFVLEQRKKSIEFTANKGFVLVAANTSISDAKKKLEQAPSCQDIFVSKDGSPGEKTIGWVSNVRLVKFLSG